MTDEPQTVLSHEQAMVDGTWPGLTANECLSLAWTYCAPQRLPSAFPRGFWPDVARVAMAMFEQQTATPTLDFRPCRCEFSDAPEIRVVSKKTRGLDLDRLEINL